MDKKEMMRQLERIRKEFNERSLKRAKRSFATCRNADQDHVGAPYGNDNAAKDHVNKNAYEDARAGKKHSGTYKAAVSKPDHLLLKSAKSHQKQANLHLSYINDPESKDPNWNKHSKRVQKNVIRQWKMHYRKNQEEANIEMEVYNKRKRSTE